MQAYALVWLAFTGRTHVVTTASEVSKGIKNGIAVLVSYKSSLQDFCDKLVTFEPFLEHFRMKLMQNPSVLELLLERTSRSAWRGEIGPKLSRNGSKFASLFQLQKHMVFKIFCISFVLYMLL